MIEQLVKQGVTTENIGVISPYRSQLLLLTKTLMKYPAVEELTVDRCQGRDKEVILVSFVRSNDSGHVSGRCGCGCGVGVSYCVRWASCCATGDDSM